MAALWKTMHGGYLDQNTQDEVRSEREEKKGGPCPGWAVTGAGPASVHQVGLGVIRSRPPVV